jgi:hypothetical protein
MRGRWPSPQPDNFVPKSAKGWLSRDGRNGGTGGRRLRSKSGNADKSCSGSTGNYPLIAAEMLAAAHAAMLRFSVEAFSRAAIQPRFSTYSSFSLYLSFCIYQKR